MPKIPQANTQSTGYAAAGSPADLIKRDHDLKAAWKMAVTAYLEASLTSNSKEAVPDLRKYIRHKQDPVRIAIHSEAYARPKVLRNPVRYVIEGEFIAQQ